jgi:hypothetical protein
MAVSKIENGKANNELRVTPQWRDRRFSYASKTIASSVSIQQGEHGSIVSKRFYNNFGSELLKHQVIEEALEGTGTCFPKIFSSTGTGNEGELKLEFIENFVSSRHFYILLVTGQNDDVSILEKAGQALGHIHAAPIPSIEKYDGTLLVPTFDALQATLPKDFVLLHGDYGFSNVGWSSSRNQVVILDPSPNYFLTNHPLQSGPRYLDLAQFVSCLCGLVGYWSMLRIKWSRVPVAIDSFVRGYESVSGFSVDRKVLLQSANESANTYFSYSMKSEIKQHIARAWFANRMRWIERHYE